MAELIEILNFNEFIIPGNQAKEDDVAKLKVYEPSKSNGRVIREFDWEYLEL